MQKKENNKKYVFRRIKGRIIPIAVATAGAGIAVDALRTKRIYQKGDIAVDVKRGVYQPMTFAFGSKATLKKKGKSVSSAFYFKSRTFEKGEFSFSWLSTKSKYRGKGYAAKLTKEVARDMKRQGGTSLLNQVVHSGSLKANYNRNRDSLWKLTDMDIFDKKTMSNAKRVTKADALKNIGGYRKKGYLTSDIFRQTKLKGIHSKTKFANPFRTKSNKIQIAIGSALAIGGLASLYMNRKKEK